MNKKEINNITNYIFVNSKPQKSDLALVFGTRHEEPLNKVLNLYDQGYIKRILVSGGINKTTKEIEGDKMASFLLEKGVKRSDIIIENRSTNSLENVLFSKEKIEKMIGFDNIESIMLIVKNYHARRAMMTMRKHFPKYIKLIPIAYDIYNINKNNWYLNKIGKEKVMGEMERIKKYLKKGDIEEISTMNFI